jgi:hypothetical protein
MSQPSAELSSPTCTFSANAPEEIQPTQVECKKCQSEDWVTCPQKKESEEDHYWESNEESEHVLSPGKARRCSPDEQTAGIPVPEIGIAVLGQYRSVGWHAMRKARSEIRAALAAVENMTGI